MDFSSGYHADMCARNGHIPFENTYFDADGNFRGDCVCGKVKNGFKSPVLTEIDQMIGCTK